MTHTARTVLLGRDYEALRTLISIHAPTETPRILDVTYNAGVMWRGTEFNPTRMDIDGQFDLDIVGDFREIPVPDAAFDVIVFDPPHLPVAAASSGSSKMWERRYGITATGEGREGDNVIGMFAPFLSEARRVLVSGGVVLAKIADITHNHRYQWQQVDYINAIRSAGMCPCDQMIVSCPSAGNLKSSKWVNTYHLRKAHCYWIVARNSTSCEAKRTLEKDR